VSSDDPKQLPVVEEANAEVTSLIAKLHRTEQRLEVLTAGEVDTVADRNGRTIVLRRAQEHLRDQDAAKQAAILNALPAQIALLDSHGRVLSVNDAWRRFSRANATWGLGSGVGMNYLEFCDSTTGEAAPEAHQLADGIRSVLDGGVKSYSIEYPRHLLPELQCYLSTVTPLTDDSASGAILMRRDVTAERQATDSLLASELQFRQLAENIREVFWLTDSAKTRQLYVSPAYEEIWGRSCQSLYASPLDWIDAIHPEDRERVRRADQTQQAHEEYVEEYRIIRPDGTIRWIRNRAFPIFRKEGEVYRIAGLAEDITERKEAEQRIAYLNRVYAMLSGINTLIVRMSDRDELFREACRIAVEAGGFRMSLLAIIDKSTKQIGTIASAGIDEDLLTAIKGLLTTSGGASNSMVTRALQEKKATVSNVLQNDPQALLCRQHTAYGVRSLAILPLVVSDDAVGILALYANESEFFHDEELILLTELAGDIAFAIDHIEKQEQLHYLAYYDGLTGLANRPLFMDRVAQHVRAAAGAGHQLALFVIDLERFKNINHSLGRPAGDMLLKQVAQWLTHNAGDVSLVARIDADHFAVVLPKVTYDGNVVRLLEKSMTAFLNHSFELNDTVYRIAAKVGVALFPDDGTDADTLFRNAEAAVKKAQVSGDQYLFYASKMTDTVAGSLGLENQLRQAVDKGEFVLHYQPKVHLVSGELTGAEALIRWNDPSTGLVPPGRFIRVLEDTGLIREVGRWALRNALAEHVRWRNAGLLTPRIAVNVSALQLRSRSFVADIEQILGSTPNSAAGLELEITESLIMEDVRHSVVTLHAIRAMGVTIAIDDFGTGFSSLSYLSKLPVDTLKIDRSFVIDMAAGADGLTLVSVIINLAHALKLKVIAEGVETEEQLHQLRLLNCDEMQGYLFGKAVPGEIFESQYLASLDLRPTLPKSRQ
jgi:diguanylate cyclase (GGDEF)-like protein/PAS domain S-box-containing protein